MGTSNALPVAYGSFQSVTNSNVDFSYSNATSLTLVSHGIPTTYGTSATTMRLGGNADGSANGPFIFCEFLCYDGEMTATEGTAVMSYLRTKWGTA